MELQAKESPCIVKSLLYYAHLSWEKVCGTEAIPQLIKKTIDYCQAQPKLQVKHSLKAELALFPFDPATPHPPTPTP